MNQSQLRNRYLELLLTTTFCKKKEKEVPFKGAGKCNLICTVQLESSLSKGNLLIEIQINLLNITAANCVQDICLCIYRSLQQLFLKGQKIKPVRCFSVFYCFNDNPV